MAQGILAKKGLYVGIGVGLVLYTLVGMVPGALIGGALGVKLAAALYGAPLEASVLPRAITALSMVLGMVAAGAVFVLGSSFMGWTAGYAADALRAGRDARATA